MARRKHGETIRERIEKMKNEKKAEEQRRIQRNNAATVIQVITKVSKIVQT